MNYKIDKENPNFWIYEVCELESLSNIVKLLNDEFEIMPEKVGVIYRDQAFSFETKRERITFVFGIIFMQFFNNPK